MKILIIGGDRRMIFAADALRKKGHTVDTLGLFEYDDGDMTDADIIILPVPVTRDLVNINCSLTGRKVPLELLKNLPERTRVFGGGNLDIINYTDYLDLDEYAIKNAVLTAEGAISFAIENTDFSLWQSKILVIGYGKTGRALANRLSGFCPDIIVSARSRRDLAELEALGIKHIKTADIGREKSGFDVVFNTVDIKFPLSSASALSDALFIDISTFGGFETDVEAYGIRYRKLPGLPALYAPATAGRIIADTVIDLQKVQGEKYA